MIKPRTCDSLANWQNQPRRTMAKKKPTTKAGKERKVTKVMGEYAGGKLKTSSGQPVKSRKQAVAIAMSEAGMKRKKGKQCK